MRIKFYSLFLLLFSFAFSEKAFNFDYTIRLAIFSKHQFFWSKLDSAEHSHSLNAAIPKPQNGGVKIGILPLQIKQYSESITCDSCHRLSANGMEFYLENYLKDKIANRFPQGKVGQLGQVDQVELIAPHLSLLKNQKVELMAYLDSITLPWEKWFDTQNTTAESAPVIYRERDRWMQKKDHKRLDSLGGQLNLDYLLLPTRVRVSVKPILSNTHTGHLDLSFGLVFWNVRKGKVEWALDYNAQSALIDLDLSLDLHLDKALGSAWDGLPGHLMTLFNAEPK